MSRPAPSETPAENANDHARVDFTAVLPFEVMVHILEVGSFRYTELAAVRLVCTSLCAAASSPILYRVLFTNLGAKTIQRVAFPRHVVDSVRRFDAGTMCVADLAVVADQFPKVRAVRAGGSYTHSKRNPFAISKLCLPVLQKCLDLDVLADFSDLEALSLRDVPRTLPCHLLSGLRRLSLVDYRGDPSDLLTSLAASPCGARLEAFSLTMALSTQFTAGWWEPLGDLVSLRELCVDAYGRCPFLEEDVDRFAALLATMSGLVTLALALSLAVADAVARHGLPSGARSLRLIGYEFLLDTMIPVMPVSLVALNLNGKVLSAANARGLLDQCPKLRVICADFQDDTLAFLSTEATFTAGSRPPLLISDRYRCFTDADFAALAVAGHSVGTPFVGVHWHVKGGLAPDAEATVGLDL